MKKLNKSTILSIIVFLLVEALGIANLFDIDFMSVVLITIVSLIFALITKAVAKYIFS